MIPAPPWTLVYADGSANRYRFEADGADVACGYEPVTPAESSTGMYRGGAPRQAHLAIDDPRLAALWTEVAALEADRAHHAATRCKGDGAFTITTAAGARHFLVVRAALDRFHALLHAAFPPERSSPG